VLDRVGDEVPARLGQPQAVGAHERRAGRRLDHHVDPARLAQRAPSLGRLVEQRRDVDDVQALARAPAPGSRRQVVERQARAAQLEVDRRHARAGLAFGEPPQRQPGGTQRPAQLVARLGHERRAAPVAQARAGHRDERERPPEGGEQAGGAHAASATSPSTSR
jgi:hypothetical protein